MSYFARNDPGQPNYKGKMINRRPLSPSRLKRGLDRDERIEQELANFHGDAIHRPGEDFLLSKLDKTKARRTSSKRGIQMPQTSRTHQSQVFAEARLSTPPKLRLRPDFNQDELSKLAPQDNRREEAAKKMENNPTLVDKMYSCNYPMPHAQEVYVPAKKRYHDELPPPAEEVNVAGFKNMGQLSKPIKYGNKAHVSANEPFVIPELAPRNQKIRYGGNKKSDFNPITNLPASQNVMFDATNPTATPRGTNQFF